MPPSRSGASTGSRPGAARADALRLPRRGPPRRLAFTAEVRGLAHYLQQPQGPPLPVRLRCRPRRRALQRRSRRPAFPRHRHGRWPPRARAASRLTGLASFADGWFTRGLLTFTTGANAGRAQRSASATPARRRPSRIELWQPIGARHRAGDTFTVTAGCDKQFATCQRQVRQRRQLPRLPAHARQRFRHRRRAPRRAANDGVAADAVPAALIAIASAHTPRAPTHPYVVALARAWLGTPYHHQASLRGVGTDCLGLVRGVWRELYGSEPRPSPPTRATGPRPRATRRCSRRRAAISSRSRRPTPRAGDIVVFRWRAHVPSPSTRPS